MGTTPHDTAEDTERPITTAHVAAAANITEDMTTYVFPGETRPAQRGQRSELILAALQRPDLTPALDSRARIAAMGLYKSLVTGRMNLDLARRVREDYSPHQLCELVAQVANNAGDDATIGYLADQWLNDHADDLRPAT